MIRPLTSVLAVALALALLTPSTVLAQTSGADVPNVAPTITSITVNGGSTITPTGASNITVNLAIVANDQNGFGDIASIAWSITDPDTTTFVATTTITNFGSCTPLGEAMSCTPTFTVGYFAKPGTYTFSATVTDAAGATGTLSVTKAVASIRSFALDVTSVSFGNLAPSAASTAQRVQVLNRGNSAIDVEVSGTALTKSSPSATIAVGQITRSLNADMSSSTALSGTPTAITDFSLNYGMGVKKATYWKLTMPSGANQFLPPGSYTGTITITAIADA